MPRRESVDLPGTAHRAPIPMGSKVGNVFYSSAIGGRNTEAGELPPDPEGQAYWMFRNMKALIEAAGGTTDDIVHVSLLLKDRAYREQIDKEWLAMFPDEHSRPARHAHQVEVGGGNLMQCEIVAVLE